MTTTAPETTGRTLTVREAAASALDLAGATRARCACGGALSFTLHGAFACETDTAARRCDGAPTVADARAIAAEDAHDVREVGRAAYVLPTDDAARARVLASAALAVSLIVPDLSWEADRVARAMDALDVTETERAALGLFATAATYGPSHVVTVPA